MEYCSLLKNGKLAFKVRVIVSKFLKIECKIAKELLDDLSDNPLSDEEFINYIASHKKAKPTSNPSISNNTLLIKTQYGHLKRVFSLLEPKVKISNITSYLDFGCGTGIITAAIAKHFSLALDSVVGLDIVEANNKIIENIVTYDGINIPNPIKSQCYDFITSFQVLHHVKSEHLKALIESLVSILRPGGYFFLKEHNCDSKQMAKLIDLEHALYETRGRDGHDNMVVNNYLSKRNLLEMFEAVGCKKIAQFSERKDATNSYFVLLQKEFIA
jgi:2-polyprenyl-3-methyl-5-hydroxy-6-metoxy-1,4-benzoquinol methylase